MCAVAHTGYPLGRDGSEHGPQGPGRGARHAGLQLREHLPPHPHVPASPICVCVIYICVCVIYTASTSPAPKCHPSLHTRQQNPHVPASPLRPVSSDSIPLFRLGTASPPHVIPSLRLRLPSIYTTPVSPYRAWAHGRYIGRCSLSEHRPV